MKYLGIDYYPEQWGMEYVDNDLDDIVELGANLIRIGDFCWDKMEPTPGNYDFSFFDEVIEKAKKRNLKVLFGVPTATIPSWLYHSNPEIMNENEYGYKQPFGARRGHCVNNDVYQEKATALASAIAKHYKDEKAIVAFQVDNEIGHELSDICYCESCHKKFIEYLKDKYKTIDELNYRMGTCFWSQTYLNFEDIELPRPAFTACNPSLRMEWERFTAQGTADFIKKMVEAIKEVDKDLIVTHDFSGGTIDKHFNPFEVSKALDFVSYNNYPIWGGQREPLTDSQLGFNVNFARGFKEDKIWVTEAIMGAQGHNDIGYSPKPYEAKKWSLDSIKHGVETIIFFRYRNFIKGAEQFCQGIIDADNIKRRKYFETKDFFNEASKIDAKYPEAKTCIIYDFDSKTSMKIQRQSDVFSYEAECQKLYNQLFIRNINCDVIDSSRDFNNYELVIIPYMIIMDDEFKSKLKNYITNGGKAVLTARTAWKDKDNNLIFAKRLPVDLDDLTGCVIEESETLLKDQLSKCEYDGIVGEGYVFEELLNVSTAKQIIKWKDNAFGEYPAATVNNYGKGKCYYIGTSLDENLLHKLFEEILK